jgi:hypothetical protein
VINEVSTDGTVAADEYVELYNAGTCVASLQGFSLKYSSASGSTPSTSWTANATDSIAVGGYFVLGGSGFTGTKNANLGGGLAVAGGGVGLYSGTVLVDSMSWGSAVVGHPFTETTPAAQIPTNKSAARFPDGTDTNDNSVDFKVPSTRSPGAANP